MGLGVTQFWFAPRYFQQMQKTLQARFENKITLQHDGCWTWKGTTVGGGYGRMHVSQTHGMKLATHVAWYLTHGYWPKQLNHKCDNPPCVNPDHLYKGNQSENMKEDYQRGRGSIMLNGYQGSNHANAKLSECDIKDIRDRYRISTTTQQQLADEFGISRPSVSRIVNHRAWSWSHV